ncbi:MAG: GNAT family N-acetyltransferase [Polyangiaceae bacterium]
MSGRPPSIRRARSGDEAQVLSFIRELAAYERLEGEVTADTASLGEHLFGDHPFAEVLLAEDDGDAAGFALYFFTFSTFLARPTLYLEDLFVRPEKRGRGIGEALLRTLAAIAVERGCGRMEWSVLDWNEPALRFYAKLGAKPMSEWTVQRLTGDALLACARGADARVEGDDGSNTLTSRSGRST